MMTCAVCRTKMVKKNRELELRIEEKLYLVRDILFDECPKCGERVIDPEVSQCLYEKIKNRNYSEEIVKLPVLHGITMRNNGNE